MARSRAEATLVLGTRVRFGLAAALLALISALAPSTTLAEQPTTLGRDAPTQPAAVHAPEYAQRVEAVIGAARAYLGTPYRVGTEGPATIDCSGTSPLSSASLVRNCAKVSSARSRSPPMYCASMRAVAAVVDNGAAATHRAPKRDASTQARLAIASRVTAATTSA